MLQCDQQNFTSLAQLLARFGLRLELVADGSPMPGSYWGAPEAGLVGQTIYARADTPVHSVLHEASHVICMDSSRRTHLHTDAGGEFFEEDAVCFLQIILAGNIGLSVDSICSDMDAWGYTFRLGSAQAWFEQDAAEARAWLVEHGVLNETGAPTWKLRIA